MEHQNWFRWGAWGIRLMLVGALVNQVVEADAVGALATGLFIVLSFGYLLREDRLPNVFDLFVALAALLNASGFVFDFYRRVPLFDEVAHAVTVFALSLAFFELVYRENTESWRRLTVSVAIFTFGVTIGALWEIAEWSTGRFFDTTVVFGLSDAITDLMANSVGALVAAIVAQRTQVAGGRSARAGRP